MLQSVPTAEHLSRLYFELQQVGAECVGEKKKWPYHTLDREALLCLAADMSRYDPRLMTILVLYLHNHWNSLNPHAIRGHYGEMNSPQTVAVLAEFILSTMDHDDEQRFFFEYLQRGLNPVPTQFYFHHLYSPGGTLAAKASMSPLAEYKRWGYLAREAPVIDAKERKTLGTMDSVARKNVLLELLSRRGKIQISDYLDALDNRISRQQALNDLKAVPWARRSGKGRGACWRFAQHP